MVLPILQLRPLLLEYQRWLARSCHWTSDTNRSVFDCLRDIMPPSRMPEGPRRSQSPRSAPPRAFCPEPNRALRPGPGPGPGLAPRCDASHPGHRPALGTYRQRVTMTLRPGGTRRRYPASRISADHALVVPADRPRAPSGRPRAPSGPNPAAPAPAGPATADRTLVCRLPDDRAVSPPAGRPSPALPRRPGPPRPPARPHPRSPCPRPPRPRTPPAEGRAPRAHPGRLIHDGARLQHCERGPAVDRARAESVRVRRRLGGHGLRHRLRRPADPRRPRCTCSACAGCS